MKFDVRVYSMSLLDMSTSTVYGLWYDDVRTSGRIPRYWPFVRVIHEWIPLSNGK